MVKTRFCIDCSTAMSVPKNSGKLRCPPCNVLRNREKARDYYQKQDRPARRKAGAKQKERILEDTSYRLLLHSRKSASSRGLDHTLTTADIIVPDVCPVLSCKMEMYTQYTASIDRIDSSKGYHKDNIQVMSWKANTMKSNATNEELVLFSEWIQKRYT